MAVVVLAVIFFGSLFKTLSLRAGGRSVAESLGGRPILPDTDDLDERRLLNVVEEMAIASGVPAPPVYVLEDQGSINAFAAGYGTDDAVIGVTRGAVRGLGRDELQGVIAHEFSHILKNGDMRLNIRLIGVLHGILVLAIVGRITLQHLRFAGGGRRDRGGLALAVLVVALGLIVIGYVGVLCGRLIKSAVSRQREYLADAAAVQFTRNPPGISGALKKIGGLSAGSLIRHPRAEEASHLYFGNGLPRATGLLATHPPLAERVRRIDPSFDGVFPPFSLPPETREPPASPDEHVDGVGRLRVALLAAAAAVPDDLLRSIGRPMAEHVAAARRAIASIPEPLISAAREPFGARAVVYALLLDGNEEVRGAQLDRLAQRADEAVTARTIELALDVRGLAETLRIPLVDLTVTALRTLTAEQYSTFRGNVDALIRADEEIDLFEFTLQHLFFRHLDRYFGAPARGEVRFLRAAAVSAEISTVLSLLARVGQSGADEARQAFERGTALLDRSLDLPMASPGRGDLGAVDAALDRLGFASPTLKRRVLAACLQCLAHDGRVEPREALLFRAVADALDCPVPPMLTTAPADEK